MSPLNPADGDRVIARLTEARAGLSAGDGEAFLARLVLLLADAVGDGDRLVRAIDEALGRAEDGPPPAAGAGR